MKIRKAYFVNVGGLTFAMHNLSKAAREEIEFRLLLESQGWEFVDWRGFGDTPCVFFGTV